jgi:hypothetical protein
MDIYQEQIKHLHKYNNISRTYKTDVTPPKMNKIVLLTYGACLLLGATANPGKKTIEKFTVCHIPKGNTEQYRDIEIPLSALQEGDLEGSCAMHCGHGYDHVQNLCADGDDTTHDECNTANDGCDHHQMICRTLTVDEPGSGEEYYEDAMIPMDVALETNERKGTCAHHCGHDGHAAAMCDDDNPMTHDACDLGNVENGGCLHHEVSMP